MYFISLMFLLILLQKEVEMKVKKEEKEEVLVEDQNPCYHILPCLSLGRQIRKFFQFEINFD